MIRDVYRLLTYHLPDYDIRSIARVGEGLDNVVDEVNGELIVRRSKESNSIYRGQLIRREAELLAVLPEYSTLRVPETVFVDIESGALCYRKLPGMGLSDHLMPDPAPLAAVVGEFLTGLHNAPLQRMATLVPEDTESLIVWRDDAQRQYHEIVEHLPRSSRALIEDFLNCTPPAEPTRKSFCHNDLGTEHLLVTGEPDRITGVIDWTDAAITDPIHDLARLYADLGADFYARTVAQYGHSSDSHDHERALFYARCCLIENIAFGIRTGLRRYITRGLAQLPKIFAHSSGP